MKKIILYGAGEWCRKTISFFEGNVDYKIQGIFDKDVLKQGKYLGNFCISAPDKINLMEYDICIVTINLGFDKVKEELVKHGVSGEKIVHCKSMIPLNQRNIGTMAADWDAGLYAGNFYDNLCSHVDELTEMEKAFLTGRHNRSFKWLNYFEIYNRHLAKYIGKEVTILEIGVNKGGSLQIWKEVFGSKARIIGVDITPECKMLEEEQIEIYIGSQEDREFLRALKKDIGRVDVLIDDGGHYMQQQIITFEELFDLVDENGVYICEDTGTSYNPTKYHSGYKKEGTWVEYSKNFIDYIHAFFSQEKEFTVNEYSKSMHSIHYYAGVCVIEKRKMFSPIDMEVCNNDSEKYAILHHVY